MVTVVGWRTGGDVMLFEIRFSLLCRGLVAKMILDQSTVKSLDSKEAFRSEMCLKSMMSCKLRMDQMNGLDSGPLSR